jgi:hypothetical protein
MKHAHRHACGDGGGFSASRMLGVPGRRESRAPSRHLRCDRAVWYAAGMATQLGKRYLCDSCGAEVLCNKPGGGELSCCDHEMKLKEAKPLPSSD